MRARISLGEFVGNELYRGASFLGSLLKQSIHHSRAIGG